MASFITSSRSISPYFAAHRDVFAAPFTEHLPQNFMGSLGILLAGSYDGLLFNLSTNLKQVAN